MSRTSESISNNTNNLVTRSASKERFDAKVVHGNMGSRNGNFMFGTEGSPEMPNEKDQYDLGCNTGAHVAANLGLNVGSRSPPNF